METIKTTSTVKNILFVDNDKNVAQEINDCLNHDETKNKFGLNAVIVKNVQEALKKVAEQKFDLIVIEILLPLVNGYHFIKKAVKDNIPIIIYTKLKGLQDISKMAESGVDNIFIKDLTNISDLIDKISKEKTLKCDLDKVANELQTQIRAITSDEIQSKIKMVQCPRCKSVLAPGSHFCNNCGQKILTKKCSKS